MSLTFLLRRSGSSGLGHFGADRLVSVPLLDRQRDGGNLRELFPPAGPVLLNEHFGDPKKKKAGSVKKKQNNLLQPWVNAADLCTLS